MAEKMKKEARVLSQKKLSEGIFDLWLETEMAKDVRPVQFVGVYPKDRSTLLPRPISICEVDKERSAIRLVYIVVGSGTTEFSKASEGDGLMILGPLGNGFPIDKAAGKRAVVIGGGIGVPPLLETAKRMSELDGAKAPSKISAVIGYRNSDSFLSDEFSKWNKG